MLYAMNSFSEQIMKIDKFLYAGFFSLLSFVFSGCLLGPDYERPETDLPETFLPGTLQGGDTNAQLNAEWWHGFNDEILLQLIDIGSTNNLSVKQAVQRVRQSRASLAESKAAYWPELGFSLNATKGKNWNPDSTTERVGTGFDASWEIDVFGSIRRSVEASKAELAAAELSLDDARISLDAEIAAEYVNLRLLQCQYAIELENLAVQTNFFNIADAKFKAGVADERDRISSEAQWRSLEASLPRSKASISAAIRRLEILLGKNPGALDSLLSPSAPVPVAPALPSAVPSDLLRRRPDVRQSEARYAAALARIGVAKAAKYPRFSIGAGISLTSQSFSNWGDAMKSMSLGPGLSWTPVDFGKREARVEQSVAAAEEASLAYRASVLSAVHEVENDWTSLEEELSRRDPLEKSAKLQARSLELSETLYKQELGDYSNVLSAQQALLNAKRSLEEHKANCALDTISLFKALGGGLFFNEQLEMSN